MVRREVRKTAVVREVANGWVVIVTADDDPDYAPPDEYIAQTWSQVVYRLQHVFGRDEAAAAEEGEARGLIYG